jgi:hypothetical protein
MNLILKMMKRFILKESQLIEYVENKKADKIYYDILEHIHKNQKYLNENVSHKNANQSVIDRFKSKKLINQKVFEMLVKHKIMNENYEII